MSYVYNVHCTELRYLEKKEDTYLEDFEIPMIYKREVIYRMGNMIF